MEKLKDLPKFKDKEKEDTSKARKIERIMTVLLCDGWEDVKEYLRNEASSTELKEKLASKGSVDFEKIGQLTYLEERANKKIEKAIERIERFRG